MEAPPDKSQQPPPKRRQRRCPVCHRPVTLTGDRAAQRLKFFPFCSERCRLVDLGAWFDGDYRIPARPDDASDEPAEDTSA
ncbi:MAG: DNA gyrase inhibitor YacG [Sedimentisphaerales bacterium]|nr:DNA gyrase inhibitor YacG [Sedimentisphaerales bacterium]